MQDVPVKILGISATGIIDGNCDNVMKIALKTAAGFDGEYGQEIDFMANYPICPDFDLTAACAFYTKGENSVDNFTEDETVFWLRGTMHF